MKPQQRRDLMVSAINELGSISLGELKKRFPDVSEMTLRRDLEALDNDRRIIRIHGGAKSVDVVIGTDDLFAKRILRNAEAKKRIAEKASALIKPNITVFLDSGTTATELAGVLPDIPYMLFTNNIPCAQELCKLTRPEVHMLGGRLNAYSHSTNGSEAMNVVDHQNFDIAFLGTTGYMSGNGFTCGAVEDAMLKRKVMNHSEKVVMLMDSRKVGLTYIFTTAQLWEVDVVVTDDDISPELRAELEQAGVELL